MLPHRYCCCVRVNNIALGRLDWCLVFRSVKCWDVLGGLTRAHLDRLFVCILNVRRGSTLGDHIEGCSRSLLNGNQLNILGRDTIVFLNLSY